MELYTYFHEPWSGFTIIRAPPLPHGTPTDECAKIPPERGIEISIFSTLGNGGKEEESTTPLPICIGEDSFSDLA